MHHGVHSVGVAVFAAFVLCVVAITVPGCSLKKLNREQTIERYSQELREAVSTKVPDEGRKAQMLLIVDQLEVVHRHFNQETAEFIESYRKLNADYDAPRATFDRLFADYRDKRITAHNQALNLHFQLASLATAGEWDTIGAAEGKLYEKTNASPQPRESTK